MESSDRISPGAADHSRDINWIPESVRRAIGALQERIRDLCIRELLNACADIAWESAMPEERAAAAILQRWIRREMGP